MNVETMKMLFALLTLAGMVGLGVFMVVSALPARLAWYDLVRPLAGWFAVAVTVASLLGSLYLSEVGKFPPCQLCWVQRGFMYPLAPITLVLASMGWRKGWWLPIIVSVIGGGVAVYHILIENGIISEGSSCDLNNPCSVKWINEFGIVTIPVMSLVAFLAVMASSAVVLSRPKR